MERSGLQLMIGMTASGKITTQRFRYSKSRRPTLLISTARTGLTHVLTSIVRSGKAYTHCQAIMMMACGILVTTNRQLFTLMALNFETQNSIYIIEENRDLLLRKKFH